MLMVPPKRRSFSRFYHMVTTITEDHTKQDLRYTQKPVYFAVFPANTWSYLLCPPVIIPPDPLRTSEEGKWIIRSDDHGNHCRRCVIVGQGVFLFFPIFFFRIRFLNPPADWGGGRKKRKLKLTTLSTFRFRVGVANFNPLLQLGQR